MERWIQEGEILKYKHGDKEVEFKVPSFFDIESVHKDSKKLAEYCLLYPDIEDDLTNYNFSRKSTNNKIGLAFSGGVDSSSILVLYEDSEKIIPFNYERMGIPTTQTSQDVNRKMIQAISEKMNIPVHIIPSDMEGLRTPFGYKSDLQYFVFMILSADILGIKYLSSGSMFDGRKQAVEWDKTTKHRTTDFLSYWKRISALLEKADMKIFYPISGCSEIITNKIVNESKIKGLPFSCLRGKELFVGCDNCFKCFRKKLLNGVLLEGNIRKQYLEAELKTPKQFPAVVYANNKFNLKMKELQQFEKYNMSHLEKYFEPDLQFIPEELKEDFKKRLSSKLGGSWENIVFN